MTEAPHPATALDWSPLLQRWQGQVFRPGERSEIGVGKQLAASGRPLPTSSLWLRARSESDVRRALDFLARHEQGFAVRSGGHCFGDLSSHAEVVLDLSELRRLELNLQGLRAGPGVSAGEASAFLTSRGRLLPTGGCPGVGLGGLALVGGFGLLGRRHGLVCEQVRALRVAMPGGELLEVHAEQEPDLFWALRGAGAGQFGVVTELLFDTQPAQGLNVLQGRWPWDCAAALIEVWQALAPEADARVNLQLGLRAGDDPEDPDDGPPQVELYGVVLAEAAEVPALLAPWRQALGTLAEALCEWRLPAAAAAAYLCGRLDRRCEPAWQPSQPYREHGYQFTKSGFFAQRLPAAAIEDLLTQFAADRRYAQHRELEFIPWGAAYTAAPSERQGSDCAFSHRAAQFMIRHTAVVGARSSAELRAHARRWAQASRATLASAGNGRVYQGYADLELPQWAQAYYGADLARLRALKSRHDPWQLMRHAQAIEPSFQDLPAI